jgi:hypothetical protein
MTDLSLQVFLNALSAPVLLEEENHDLHLLLQKAAKTRKAIEILPNFVH